jgi:hypothetical protein
MTITSCDIVDASFIKSDTAGLLLYADQIEASREFVRGLFNLKPPGRTRGSGTAEEFSAKSMEYATTVVQTGITGNANDVRGDATQAELIGRLNCQTRFTDMWFYKVRDKVTPTNDLIIIPDIVKSPNGFMEVKDFDPQAAGVNTHWQNNFALTVSTLLLEANVQYFDDGSAPDIAFVSGSPDTITSAQAGFITAGFQEGMRIYIDDLAAGVSNFGKIVTIAASGVAAGTLTLVESGYLTNDAVGASTVVLRGGYPY